MNSTNRSHNPSEEDALVTDFLDEKRDEIDDRLAELRPLVEEYNRLQAAAAALRGVDGSSAMSVVMSSASPELSDVSVPPRDEGSPADGDGEAPSAQASELETPPMPVRRGPGRPRGSAGSRSREGNGDGVSSGPADAEDGGTESASPTPGSSGAQRRAGRPKGSGTRAAEALRIVREHPGVTIPELADRMGIKQNYLYRVLPDLVQEGKVAKQGRGWHPRAA